MALSRDDNGRAHRRTKKRSYHVRMYRHTHLLGNEVSGRSQRDSADIYNKRNKSETSEQCTRPLREPSDWVQGTIVAKRHTF